MPRRRDVVKLDLGPLHRFKRELEIARSNRMQSLYRKWAARYLGFARAEYMKSSRGNGRWLPLDPKTVARRRKGGKRRGGTDQARVNRRRTGGAVAILRDTGTLFAALEIGRPDNFKLVPRGVRVGFLSRSPAMERDSDGSQRPADISIAELAAIHHFGKGHNPKRPIIIQPNKQTVDGMMRDVRRAARLAMRHHEKRR